MLACSSQDIEYWRDKNENLEEDKRLLETQIKSQKRQNKLLKVALTKSHLKYEELLRFSHDYVALETAADPEPPRAPAKNEHRAGPSVFSTDIGTELTSGRINKDTTPQNTGGQPSMSSVRLGKRASEYEVSR